MELSAREIGDFKSRLERVEKELNLKKATVSYISNFIDLFELLWLQVTKNHLNIHYETGLIKY